MIGPSSSVAAGRGERNWRVSPRQVQALHSLWGARLRRAGRKPRPERSREERLLHFAEIVGRPVASCRELSWREANRVIHRLLEEARRNGPSASRPVAEARGAASTSESRTASAPAAVPASDRLGGPPPAVARREDAPSDAQLWKIRQIEQYLGWGRPGKDERRLAGFLRAKFHVKQPEELTADAASRALEGLCAAGARGRIKARQGTRYAVKRAELTREIAALKHELKKWRPTES